MPSTQAVTSYKPSIRPQPKVTTQSKALLKQSTGQRDGLCIHYPGYWFTTAVPWILPPRLLLWRSAAQPRQYGPLDMHNEVASSCPTPTSQGQIHHGQHARQRLLQHVLEGQQDPPVLRQPGKPSPTTSQAYGFSPRLQLKQRHTPGSQAIHWAT